MIMRSAKVPESPSSALQTIYFRSPEASDTVRHLMPVGKPAPPRPRRRTLYGVDDRKWDPSRERVPNPGSRLPRGNRRATAIDQAATGEGEPSLAGKEWNLVWPPQA